MRRTFLEIASTKPIESIAPANAAAISTADASIHAGELTGSVLNGIIIPTTVDDPFISLPTANGVTWASSDSSVIATDGTVNQPAKGEAAKTVTLTAAGPWPDRYEGIHGHGQPDHENCR